MFSFATKSQLASVTKQKYEDLTIRLPLMQETTIYYLPDFP